MSERDCPLCDAGFALNGADHVPSQAKGMIPVTRCRKQIPRGAITRFRRVLNLRYADVDKHRNGRFQQVKRPYGDYLYAQDWDKFIMELCEWLPQQSGDLSHPK